MKADHEILPAENLTGWYANTRRNTRAAHKLVNGVPDCSSLPTSYMSPHNTNRFWTPIVAGYHHPCAMCLRVNGFSTLSVSLKMLVQKYVKPLAEPVWKTALKERGSYRP